jgi:uncharacterized protein (DUF1778 family)
MARPKKTPGQAKGTYFRFRCTEEEKKLIEQAASSRSLDASAWARSELVALARKYVIKK